MANKRETEAANERVQRFMDMVGPPGDDDVTLVGALLCSVMVLNSVIERSGNRLLEEHGLTLPQWLALGAIARGGETGVPHSQIGQVLMLSKAPITGVVDRLERAGFARRQPDARDRRVSRAVATPQGVEMWHRVEATLRAHGKSVVDGNFSRLEQETMLRLTSRLMDAMSQNEQNGTAPNGISTETHDE